MPKQRNSSIELLRIIAMFMIVAHHLVEKNAFNIYEQAVGFRKFFFQVVLFSGGKIGVVVFFTITAWFFLDREQTIKASLKRIWLLERELLFWSITLCVGFLVFARSMMTTGTLLKSLFPLSFGLWWYPTSYALFLLLLPFLAKGLCALEHDMHRALCIVILIAWGVYGLIPMTHTADNVTGVFGLCFLFILIAYYRWYCTPITVHTAWAMIATGYAMITLCWMAFNLIWMKTGRLADYATFAAGDWKPAPVLIGFGLFVLFERRTFHSHIINSIAASAFGVYLVSMYPQVVTLLWHEWFDTATYYDSQWAPLIAVGIVVAVYAGCTIADMLRRLLFSLTIDRRRSHLFDKLSLRLTDWK